MIKKGILLAVFLMVVAVVMPTALGLIAGAGQTAVTVNGTSQLVSDLLDPSVLTLFQVLIPIIAVIGIVLGILNYAKGGGG